jgi:hypothetical protein
MSETMPAVWALVTPAIGETRFVDRRELVGVLAASNRAGHPYFVIPFGPQRDDSEETP